MNDGALWLLTEEGTKVVSSRVLACCTAHVKIRRKRVWAGWIQAAVARMEKRQNRSAVRGSRSFADGPLVEIPTNTVESGVNNVCRGRIDVLRAENQVFV